MLLSKKRILILALIGIGVLAAAIVNMKMAYLGAPGVDEKDFFALLIALIIIGVSIFIYREQRLKKRRIVQLSSLFFLNLAGIGIIFKILYAPYLHCYACPLASTACPIGALQNFIILGKIPYYLIGYTTIFFTIVGRAFCGWICPFGLLQDGVDKIFNRKKRMTHQFRFTKFIVLALMILAAWQFSDTLFCKVCPAGFIGAAVPYRIEHGMIFDTIFVLRIVFFIVLMGIIFFISRFWCRYLCPIGAWAGIFNKISFVHLKVDTEKCTRCGICREACPQGIDPVESERSTDCTLCGECVEACPTGALELVTPTMPSREELPEEISEKKVINQTPLPRYEPVTVYKSTDEIGFYDIPPEVKKLKIEYYHLDEEIPPILEWLEKYMTITATPVESSSFLEPTLVINNRIFVGDLTEEGILYGLRDEIAMGKMLNLVFDLKKCKFCKARNCGLKIIGETGLKVEPLIDYPDFSEIIASCTRNAVFLAYGEPKIENYNKKFILSQDLPLEPLEAELIIEKDSKYCNRALTLFALLSYASNGAINFKPREHTKSDIPFKIRSLPSVIAKEQRFYLTTERGLIKFLQRL
jgi:polyferredoxin